MKDYPYIIMTDISADLSPELVKENDIKIIPMLYLLDDEERICSSIGDEAQLREFYDCQRRGGITKTTQISPQNYIEAFTPYAQEGKSILYLSLSSGLSGTYNSSVMSAKSIMEKYPDSKIICVDSLSATGGMGILLQSAINNRDKGMSLEENAEWLKTNRFRVCHWFMVEDLMYLKRGGRISATTAAVGTALNILPILKIDDDGKLVNFAKKRGVKTSLNKLVELYASSRDGGEDEIVYIMHSDSDENADYLVNAVREINPKCQVSKLMLSPIIGSHTGPGMCAIVNFGNRKI